MQHVSVTVEATDPITRSGIAACLATERDISVRPAGERTNTHVLVVAVERLAGPGAETLRNAAAHVDAPVVLLAGDVDENDLLSAVECRVVAILPRAAAGDERLAGSIRTAAAGGARMPPNLLGHLLEHLQRLDREVLAPEGLTMSGLSERELAVLRMLAAGQETRDIARELCYSERTVKNVIYSITTRFQLRNRQHAVAYAVRAGVI